MRAASKILYLFIASSFFLLSWQVAGADRIYKWKDSAGIMHFTNNKANIPPQYRVETKDMMALPSVGNKRLSKSDIGGSLWRARCASCHTAGVEKKKGLRPLASTVIDPSTRFARTEGRLLPILRQAVAGRTTDMKAMEISDADLLEISRYLIKFSKKY